MSDKGDIEMYCRLIEATVPAENMDSGFANLEAHVVPRVAMLPGFRGAYWFAQRQSGRFYAVTFFDSAASIDASREQADAIRREGMAAGGVTPGPVREMEVVAATGARVSRSATHARITRTPGDPAAVKSQPGFMGGFQLSEAATGVHFAATLWESASAAGNPGDDVFEVVARAETPG